MNIWWKRVSHVLLLGAAFAVFSEQRSCATPSLALPPTAARWNMASPAHCAKPDRGDFGRWRGTVGARQVCRVDYAGSPGMTLTLYDMPEWPGATAFDAMQRWDRQPGKMAFYKGRYFGVVESSPEADTETVSRFIIALEAALPPAPVEFHR
jgi:hypothetical protein